MSILRPKNWHMIAYICYIDIMANLAENAANTETEFDAAFFDESSRAWMENKVRVGAQIHYRCEYIHSNQQRCKKPCETRVTTVYEYCKKHKRMGKIREVKQERQQKQEVPPRVLNLRSRNIPMHVS